MVRRKSGWGICVLPCGFGLCFGCGYLPSKEKKILVSDTMRKIDYGSARLLGTLPVQVDTTGLKLADSDMLVVLLKSLPEAVKNYILYHSSADTYESYRKAAVRWKEQHGLFSDFKSTGTGKKLNSVEGNTEYYSLEEFGVDTVEGRGVLHRGCQLRSDAFVVGKQDMSVTITLHVRKVEKKREGEKGKSGLVKSDMWDKKVPKV